MKAYQISAKQLVGLALLTAFFAGTVVVVYDKIGPALWGRWAGAKENEKNAAEAVIAEITDPSVAMDEKNNSEVYKAISPGVVNITSTNYVQSWFDVYPQEGSGSGSILDKEGHILTNYHVVQGQNGGYAQQLMVSLANGKNYKATPVGADPDNDIAIIKINAPAESLSLVPLGNSGELFVGKKVLAIGNPFGLERTLTTGVISGLARPLHSDITNRLIEGVIQTDAAINPGNSGGPLLDSRGRMIGINTMIYSPSGGSVGIGFAVPVDTAKRIIPDIIKLGYARKPSLGITAPLPVNQSIANQLRLPVEEGLMVSQVYEGGAADKAGIQGGNQPVRYQRQTFYLGGDIITAIDGQPMRVYDDLDRVINRKNIGDKVKVEVMRGEKKLSFDVTLTERPRPRG
ncbi:MAG: trypsin-like peptidase domain-containing protein [Acidobacteria bacterium]|nr:trypsin-like peptidase domain-containing protein [Acidobacteriota bacterium]